MKKLIYSFLFVLCSVLASQTELMIVTIYNLCNANAGDSTNGNDWGQRYPCIAQLVQLHGLDIPGTQEGKYHQLQDLKNAIPGYNYVEVRRDDGKQAGEYSAILYHTGKFKMLDHGDFWLSTITGRPNKGWDAVLPRTYTWGKFRGEQTGFIFLFFNLYMSHIGVQTRTESTKLILKRLKEFSEKLPAILAGDFNVGQRNKPYLLLGNSDIIRDPYQIADFRYVSNGTFNAFHVDRKTDSRIDRLLLTKEFDMKEYGVLTDIYRSEAKDAKNE